VRWFYGSLMAGRLPGLQNRRYTMGELLIEGWAAVPSMELV
jgi:hypothetical protein